MIQHALLTLLPKRFDGWFLNLKHMASEFDVLIGKELSQISCGLYQIIFHFSEEVSLTVEHEMVYAQKGASPVVWSTGGRVSFPTQLILGLRVKSVTEEDDKVVVVFENENLIEIRVEKDRGYESLQLVSGSFYYIR